MAAEEPIYVKVACNNCGYRWESYKYVDKCSKCGSTNISQNAMISGL